MAKNDTPNSMSPEDFDLTAWLEGEDSQDITTRPHETVTLYKGAPDIEAALAEVEEAERALADGRQKASTPDPDATVADPAGPDLDKLDAAVEAAKKKASKTIGDRRLEVTLYQLIDPEIETATKGTKRGTNAYLYEVLAAAARLPGGTQVGADQWGQIHSLVGQTQFNKLDQALARLYTADPAAGVDAVFSQRS